MTALKTILSFAILIMCTIMFASTTLGTVDNTGWLVALVGWLEIVVNQRKDATAE
jgi:hypothetical protein